MERFLEVEKSSFNQTEQQINLLEKYLKDYKILQEKLKILPNEFMYNIMVPFGSVGFMPGRLVHTNELRILIGDDWFLETSANNAVNIIERRNAKLEDQIIALKKQNTLIEQRINYVSQQTSHSEDNNIIEIKEDYDENEELLWNEKHKENLKKYYQNLAQEKQKISENLSNDFWAKYEDEENEDIQILDDSKNGSLKRRVSFGKDIKSTNDDNNYEINMNYDNYCNLKEKTIFFSHSNHKPITSSMTDELNSPADVYKNYIIIPKSILKKQSTKSISSDDISIPELLEQQLKDITPQCFNEKEDIPPCISDKEDLIPPCLSVVVEKTGPCQDKTNPIQHYNQPVKISKFKASRLNISK